MPNIVESHIEVEVLNSTFQVNETIEKSNFIVKFFNAENPLGIVVNDYTLTPTSFTRVGNRQQLTFAYNSGTSFMPYYAQILCDAIVQSDKLYTFDKTTLTRAVFGDFQADYNMSFTLDGTKDSCQVVVYNHIEEEIKPNTIVYLEATDTWWIVDNDTSKRITNEQNPLYEHTIQLIDAINILNARDMINCGFNVNHYTYGQFFTRLASMFDFELPITFDYANCVAENNKVNYLKTFDNYSPLSALNEMANGLNAVLRMDFAVNGNGTLTGATIHFISKSGSTEQPIQDTYFTSAEQTFTSKRGNYGARVVSNVQNCVSASEVRYPAVGGVKLSSEENTLHRDRGPIGNQSKLTNNLIVRLPSKVYKMLEMKMYYGLICEYDEGALKMEEKVLYANEIDDFVKLIKQYDSEYTLQQADLPFFEELLEKSHITIKNGGYWENDNGSSGTWHHPYIVISNQKFCLNDKNHYETCIQYQRTIYWEQGSNLVRNFDLVNLNINSEARTFTHTFYVGQQDRYVKISLYTGGAIGLRSRFAFRYIPMNNLKVKVDNKENGNDTNIYNQNGKLVDSVSVSKLINEHAKDISSNELTFSKVYYDYNSIIDVGQRVIHNGETYIVNNISLDFSQNELYGYMIQAQFTMTKDSACKSTLISANTNIRDYDCPQLNNIERIQTYRDYVELGYTLYSQVQTYLHLDNLFTFTSTHAGLNKNYTAFIKVQDDEFIDAQDNPNGNFYYVIGTTKYELNKQTIIQIDFRDNNIIGYESNGSYKLLTPSSMISLAESSINTPISYVNTYGEIKEIDLMLLNEEKIYSIYGIYSEAIGGSISIPSSYWLNAYASAGHDILIEEPNYKKDGLEVPIFQYSVQVGNNEGIVFGNKFLSSFNKGSGSYSYKYVVSQNEINENNATLIGNNTCTITKSGRELQLEFNGNSTDLYGKNIGIFITYTDTDNNQVKELLFAINNCKSHATTDLTLYINSYKLK